MKLNMGYPWLCLCLFFALTITACTIKRTVVIPASPAVSNNDTYLLQVKLIADGTGNNIPGEFISCLVHPFDAKYWCNGSIFRPETLILYFRFSDLKQLQQCRDQLLSTGQVEQISIAKY
jgi:hypothetical protein